MARNLPPVDFDEFLLNESLPANIGTVPPVANSWTTYLLAGGCSLMVISFGVVARVLMDAIRG